MCVYMHACACACVGTQWELTLGTRQSAIRGNPALGLSAMRGNSARGWVSWGELSTWAECHEGVMEWCYNNYYNYWASRKCGRVIDLGDQAAYSVDLGDQADPVDLGDLADPIDLGDQADPVDLGNQADPVELGYLAGWPCWLGWPGWPCWLPRVTWLALLTWVTRLTLLTWLVLALALDPSTVTDS